MEVCFLVLKKNNRSRLDSFSGRNNVWTIPMLPFGIVASKFQTAFLKIVVTRIAIATSDQTKWAEYKRLRNEVNHSIIASKKAYYQSFFIENVCIVKVTWNGTYLFLSRTKRDPGGLQTAKAVCKFIRNLSAGKPDCLHGILSLPF